MAIKLLGGGGSAVWLGHTYHDRVYRPIWRNYPENSSSYPFGPLVAAYRPSLRGYARIPLSSGCSESAFSFRAGGPSRSHASLGLFSHRWFVLCGRLKLVAGRFHPPGTDSTWTTRVSNNSPRLG